MFKHHTTQTSNIQTYLIYVANRYIQYTSMLQTPTVHVHTHTHTHTHTWFAGLQVLSTYFFTVTVFYFLLYGFYTVQTVYAIPFY